MRGRGKKRQLGSKEVEGTHAGKAIAFTKEVVIRYRFSTGFSTEQEQYRTEPTIQLKATLVSLNTLVK